MAPPDDDPDSEPVPHLPPQLKALEWLDTMGSPDDAVSYTHLRGLLASAAGAEHPYQGPRRQQGNGRCPPRVPERGLLRHLRAGAGLSLIHICSEAIPEAFRGLPITLIDIGVLALAIYGFTGHSVIL